MRATYRPLINICRRMASDSKVSNSPKVTKSSKSKGSQKKTEKKTSEKSTAQPTEQKVKFEPQIDDGTYRAKEYYEHNPYSFNDYMTDMSKYRLPQPSNKS